MTATPSDPLLLPEGAVLVHIGMHKTGTTAMQTLLAAQRPVLEQHGVVYPGPRPDHHGPARAFTQRSTGRGGADKPPPAAVWDALVAELAGERRRVVISSEFFSGARDGEPVRLARDLGRERTHVLVGVRHPAESTVSAWQQSLKHGRISDLDRFAGTVLPRDGRPPQDANFWAHWDLGAVVRRWAEAVGTDHQTVVVVDRADRDRLPATFEGLLGLPAGTLVGQPAPVGNRGMTAIEAELVRRLNAAVRTEVEWPDYRRIVRRGVIRWLVENRRPGPDEPRPALPAWAQEVTRAAGERAAAEIRASGVRVVGDLDELHAPRPAAGAPEALDQIPMELAVEALTGAVSADKESGARRVEEIPARELVQALGGRARRRVAWAAARARRRSR